MKTKILLSIAVLAAGLVAAQADTVYSANVVGYYNFTVHPDGSAIVGNQLINGSDALQTNNDINACLTAGLISDPNGPP